MRVPNSFMKAVLDDKDQYRNWRIEKERTGSGRARAPEPCKTLKATNPWDQIAYAVWSCADPGTQYHDTINEWHTCPEDDRCK